MTKLLPYSLSWAVPHLLEYVAAGQLRRAAPLWREGNDTLKGGQQTNAAEFDGCLREAPLLVVHPLGCLALARRRVPWKATRRLHPLPYGSQVGRRLFHISSNRVEHLCMLGGLAAHPFARGESHKNRLPFPHRKL